MNLQICCLSVVITAVISTQGYGFILNGLEDNKVQKEIRAYVNPSNPVRK